MISAILFAGVLIAVVIAVWYASEPRCKWCRRTAAESARVTRGQVCVRCTYEDA